MKDPLQIDKTPYEILGVDKNSDQGEINKAFRLKLLSGENVAEITGARNTLSDPGEKALLDILLYDDSFISRLRPSAGSEGALTQKRAATMDSWRFLLNKFLNTECLHCMAVLTYRWALYCENAKLGDEGYKGEVTAVEMPASLLWLKTIGYWAAMISYDEHLKTWAANRKDVDTKALPARLESHFINLFNNYVERYQKENNADEAKRFYDYGRKFITEVGAGRKLSIQKIKLDREEKSFKAFGGKIFLSDMGLLDTAIREINNEMKLYPLSEKLRSLYLSLSELSEIAGLIQDKKYDEALESLNALPAEKKEEAEAIELFATVYFETCKIQFNANKFTAAFDCWKKAVDVFDAKRSKMSKSDAAKLDALFADMQKKLAELVNTKTAALQKNDAGAAIEILEQAVKAIKDSSIKLKLGDMINSRSIKILNEVYNDTDEKVIGIIEKEIANLEYAVKLGCERAGENLDAAKKLLIVLREDLSFSSQEAREAIKQAKAKASGRDYYAAILILKQYLKKAPKADKEPVKKKMASYLNTRAVDIANRVQNYVNNEIESKLASFMGSIMTYGKSRYSSPFGNLYGYQSCDVSLCSSSAAYKFTVKGYGEISLCQTHADRLRAILNGRVVSLNRQDKADIVSAKKDLKKAYKYEKNKLYKDNLNVVGGVLNKVL